MLDKHRLVGRVFCIAMAIVLGIGAMTACAAATGKDVQTRITQDVDSGLPVVVHVVVALCDPSHQSVAYVPVHLGNGRDPRSNLYWGALYGVRTFFARHGGWASLSAEAPSDSAILERAVFFRRIKRSSDGASVIAPVYVVADAWDGAAIMPAITRFLRYAAGREVDTVAIMTDSSEVVVMAGGASHIVAYVGHNALIESHPEEVPVPAEGTQANSSIVLACGSQWHFLDPLHQAGSHPLLLTTDLMAPEAYTLDAAIRSWIAGESVAAVREAAARAYDTYQKCGLRGARAMFWGESP